MRPSRSRGAWGLDRTISSCDAWDGRGRLQIPKAPRNDRPDAAPKPRPSQAPRPRAGAAVQSDAPAQAIPSTSGLARRAALAAPPWPGRPARAASAPPRGWTPCDGARSGDDIGMQADKPLSPAAPKRPPRGGRAPPRTTGTSAAHPAECKPFHRRPPETPAPNPAPPRITLGGDPPGDRGATGGRLGGAPTARCP